MTNTMRALVGGVGPDWEPRELAIPAPAPGQILIRVRAAGLNRADLYMLEGSYSPNSKTSNVYTAGLELAGEVAAIGAGTISDYAVHLYIGTSSWMAAHVPYKKTESLTWVEIKTFWWMYEWLPQPIKI